MNTEPDDVLDVTLLYIKVSAAYLVIGSSSISSGLSSPGLSNELLNWLAEILLILS